MKSPALSRCALLFLVLISISHDLTASPEPDVAFWDSALLSRPELEPEWTGSFEHDGIRVSQVQFTASTWEGKPQRVYGIFATPEGEGPFPAILQIHGGGQTAYPENLAWFVRNGYACMSYDWTGPRDERSADQVTHWSGPIAGNYFRTDDQPDEADVIYHAILAGIAALDVLAAQPEVDADRIGVQGISWGGLLCWMVTALDERVRVAVPVYGIGGFDGHTTSIGRAWRSRSESTRLSWQRRLDPFTWVTELKAPVMYLDGLNDFFGPLDVAESAIARASADVRRAYSPNRMHGLDPDTVRAAMAWFDAHLKPGQPDYPDEPKLSLKLRDDGMVCANITLDTSVPVERVSLDYSRGDLSVLARGWLSAPATHKEGDLWTAEIPVVHPSDSIMVVAQVHYERHGKLSSAVGQITPTRVDANAFPSGLASDVLIKDGRPEHGGWYIHRGTDFTHAESPDAKLATLELGEPSRPALVLEPQVESESMHIATRLPAETGLLKGNNRALELWVHDAARIRLRVNWFTRIVDLYPYQCTLEAGPGWHKLSIWPSDLVLIHEGSGEPVEPGGHRLADWNNLVQFNLILEPVEDGRPGLGSARWAP